MKAQVSIKFVLTLYTPSLIPSVSPSSPNYYAGYLNFAHIFRETLILRELSRINMWNKKHFVVNETDIALNAIKCCNVLTA